MRSLAFFMCFLGAAGCFGRAVTLETGEHAIRSDSGNDVPSATDASYDAHGGPGMIVDGIPCTEVTVDLTTKAPADGHTWHLDLKGTCGALGVVDAFIRGKDNAAYPQSCSTEAAFVRASIGTEGDAGWLAYDSSARRGSCSITSGPSVANQAAPIAITAVVENESGETHTLSYQSPAPAPGAMQVDGIGCTGVSRDVTTQAPADGHTWILDLKASCGPLGIVEAFITGKDNAAYPQSCAGPAFVRASIGAEGDAGALAYDSSEVRGSCSITSGPTVANPSVEVAITAVLENTAGKTHSFSYAP